MAGELSSNLPWELANSKWSARLNPLLANPLVNGRLLEGVALDMGTNVINHGLQRKLRGYIVVLNSEAETFYDGQTLNQRPDLVLILNASGPTVVSLYVF